MTDAIVEAVEAPRESVRIILREVPPLHFGVAGKTKEKTERAARLKGDFKQPNQKTGRNRMTDFPSDDANS